MNLIIVESPTKAKTISRFVGKDYIVKSSFGHIRDLPKSELGIDVEHDFEPKYVIPTRSRKAVSELKKDVDKADKIILAPDPDREGEAIAWHLIYALQLDKPKNKDKEVERVVFHEITKSAIEHAIESPGKIDNNLVDAQQARRILDRLVGYKLSPFLWKKIARGLSAGRVQSVAVKLIVEREEEIRAFKPEEYWTVTALFEDPQNVVIEAELSKVDGKVIDKLEIKNKEEADKILSSLKEGTYKIVDIERKEMVKRAKPPFTTSTLQQVAAHKLYFSAKQTMRLAQQLYEGMETSEGSVGLITYMRTDSTNLSQDSLNSAQQVILQEFGKDYYDEPKRYKTKSKGAQEAHEAIRPADPRKTPESLRKYLDDNQFKLYNLIWSRFMASQMTNAIFDKTGIVIETDDKKYGFQANGSVMKFDGFLKVYPIAFEDKQLPEVKKGEALTAKEINPEQHFTKPPARYNEASLVKILESHGIGRPSTYAPIISTIQERNYVIKNQSKGFEPTEIGEVVNKVLTEHFPEIVDIEFTSNMEDSLDDIADGKKEWVPVLRKFYEPFAEKLENKYKEVTDKEVIEEKTDQKCSECGGDMVIKLGRYGKFLACSKFPDCKHTEPLEKPGEKEVEYSDENCEECSKQMVIRKGRYGKFLACSGYPDCKYTKRIKKDKPDGKSSS